MGRSSSFLLDKNLGVVFLHVNHSLSGAQDGNKSSNSKPSLEHGEGEASPWEPEGIQCGLGSPEAESTVSVLGLVQKKDFFKKKIM